MDNCKHSFTVSVFDDENNISEKSFTAEAGKPIIFVGANGSGKTRLTSQIDVNLNKNAHRISAHRALNLNPNVDKINEISAKNELFSGNRDSTSSKHWRWSGKYATALLNDYDSLLQYLFAEQNNIALKTHKSVSEMGSTKDVDYRLTKLEILANIWSRLLPNSKLDISADDILVQKADTIPYSASEMSDGERSLFYLIGQVLSADSGQLIIIDEPELHIHPSIMSKLWDELEAQRPDCAFLFITHDLTFAKRKNAQKYVLRDYRAEPQPAWLIENVPENSEFSEELATLILGSRHPILFVEGKNNSLDFAFYSCCYPDWTVIPAGSCGEVIRAVKTLQSNSSFTRINCAGLVDNDHRTDNDIEALLRKNIYVLPVNEIENIILLPAVSKAILESEGYTSPQLEEKLEELKTNLLEEVKSKKNIDAATFNFIDRITHNRLKSINIDKKSKSASIAEYVKKQIDEFGIDEQITWFKDTLNKAIDEGDLLLTLKLYDNKGMVHVASQVLKDTDKDSFIDWIKRNLRMQPNSPIAKAIKEVLPNIPQK